jgi:F-type H+-transporting ATPase subunit delta
MIEKITQARPYARAIFSIAKRTGNFAEWLQTLKILEEISIHPEVQRLLRDRTIPPASLAKLFETIYPLELNTEIKNFLNLLAERRRLSVLPEIAHAFEQLWDEEKQLLPVEFKSVVPLTDAQQKDFATLLSKKFGKKIEIDNQIDPSLLAGFWIKAGDHVIDGSIRGHLEQLKASMGE